MSHAGGHAVDACHGLLKRLPLVLVAFQFGHDVVVDVPGYDCLSWFVLGTHVDDCLTDGELLFQFGHTSLLDFPHTDNPLWRYDADIHVPVLR